MIIIWPFEQTCQICRFFHRTPNEHKTEIKQIDEWISNTYLTSIFRLAIDGEINLNRRYKAWRLAALISAHTPLPEHIRNMWPDILKLAPFIQDMAKHIDLTESHEDMHTRIISELATHIGDGPYIGGFDQPTMLDLAVYPNAIWNYMFGIDEDLRIAKNPITKAWLKNVSQHLPENPCLTPDNMIINPLKECLA